MLQFIVLRLHPDTVVNGASFAQYLPGLTLDVYARTYQHPNGVLIGTAANILAHSWGVHTLSVATAVIEVPAAAEFAAFDLKIVAHRGAQQWQYDWSQNPATYSATTAPATTAYRGLTTVSAYLTIPPQGQLLETAGTHIELSNDGTPPSFGTIAHAVGLANGSYNYNVAALTEAQALTLGYRISQDYALYTMPLLTYSPIVDLEVMYTLDYVYSTPGDLRKPADANAAIALFTSSLTTQQINAAKLMGQYVFAYSAALAAETTSKTATSSLLTVPAHTTSNPQPGKLADADMNIQFTPSPTLSFGVPAAYFYALTYGQPASVTAAARYQQVLSGDPDASRITIDAAVTAGTINATDENFVPPGSLALLSVTPAQAVRRLHALGGESGAPVAPVTMPATIPLVSAWLAYNATDDIANFWTAAVATNTGPDLAGQLEFMLDVVTDDMPTLANAIRAIPVVNVDQLAAFTENDWDAFITGTGLASSTAMLAFLASPGGTANRTTMLSPNLLPGASADERVAAFVGVLRKYYAVLRVAAPTPVLTPVPPPQLDTPAGDLFQQFVDAYEGATSTGYTFSTGLSTAAQSAIDQVAGDDACVSAWLKNAVQTLSDLQQIAGGAPQELRFSVMEALYARGFADKAAIQAQSLAAFTTALTGTVAYPYAAEIYERAEGSDQDKAPEQNIFLPINPDRALTNCIPPAQLSPLGPIAYLHDILRVSGASTCADPIPDMQRDDIGTLAVLLQSRRGPLGNLSVTQANLETPIPYMDIVNENLEAMVAASGTDGVVPAASAHGVVYDTASTSLNGHLLHPPGAPVAGRPYLHDPIVLLGAIPEHSSPASPGASAIAYDKLRKDFSAPNLPYAQALDVERTYLDHLGTSRFETMKCFRKDIREFLQDPANPPAGFESKLLREPCRPELFCEYLRISPEEYAALFTSATIPPSMLFGYPANASGWTENLSQVPEFLKRTGLSYCELIALRDALGEKIQIYSKLREQEVPICEPCCLQDLLLEFEDDQEEPLRRIAIFIRLWRLLQALPTARYSFAQLRDICDVLGLFNTTTGAVNPDFIRQLSAFQRLRDNLRLSLLDREDHGAPPNPTGADSTHLLALWAGPSARKYAWAVALLLHHLELYAQRHHGCCRRAPEFVKLLAANLEPLAILCGVQPWNKSPTHTVRFAEVLAKIYASEFTVGEILFVCTNAPHLAGDDPFFIATARESNDSPLDLPDDDERFSLWALRRELLSVDICDEDAEKWTWSRIEASLKRDFGYVPSSSGADALTDLGRHFFPSVLERSGQSVPAGSVWYRAPLASQSAPMWNTPEHGPFHYYAGASELRARIPFSEEAVLTKLSRLPQLDALQCRAVRDLYFAPRAELARFAFIFADFEHAVRHLTEEADEKVRWSFFRDAFALCHARCARIAAHLAEYAMRARDVDDACREKRRGDTVALAWKVLGHLFADENRAVSTWENDSGQAPAVTWPRPGGGAFAALLGLVGTGLVGEFRTSGSDQVVWRELAGGHVFSPARDAWNAPVPTVIPAMDLTIPNDAQLFQSVRNGLGLANVNAEMLGGLQGFSTVWRGGLLIEREGRYQFWTGMAGGEGELPQCSAEDNRCWRLILKQGQREWVCLSHNWRGEESRASCDEAVHLRRGIYRLEIEFDHPQPHYKPHDEICPQRTGFQIKYKGPDTDDCVEILPFSRLFQERKTQPLLGSLKLSGGASAYLSALYTSSLSDIRHTFWRAMKALIFADRFDLSAKPCSDDGQSELGYMLDHPGRFAGTAYYPSGGPYQQHLAFFDFNLLPVSDPYNPDFDYTPPMTMLDERALDAFSTPVASLKRPEALFAVWERIFDYTLLRRMSRRAPERTAWLLFHEAAENHPNDPDQLLWHLDVDISHQQAVLNYFGPYAVATADLEDERWPLRIARANRYLERVKRDFLAKDIRDAKPDLWAANDPGDPATPGNVNLVKFVQDGSFERGEPRRAEHIKRMNDGLRERGRAALVAFLCVLNRVTLSDGAIVHEAKQLSELLLLDVETGVCEKASRIEEAITAVELFVQRARLGLEPSFKPGSGFCLLWDRQFSTFRAWEACKRREIYQENWIEWDEIEKARETESFRFLEDRLRRGGLTSPVPGGDVYWPRKALPPHDGLAPIQDEEPSRLQRVSPQREGFALMGVPERQARLSWLAGLDATAPTQQTPRDDGLPPQPGQSGAGCLPLWIEAPVWLGQKFVRVAAADVPEASLDICRSGAAGGCCCTCGKVHEPSIDEYYFWLIDARQFTETGSAEPYQDPLWDWHNPTALPGLLQWDSNPIVHLAWSRFHNGEFQTPRRSSEGVRLGTFPPDLVFMGRTGDSLRFEVANGIAPVGYASSPPPGFRYDMAPDAAIVLPQVAALAAASGLPAFPYFLYFPPGDSLYPQSCFAPSLAIGDHLRAHCRFEEALKWYECAYAPLERDNHWAHCDHDDVQGPAGPIPGMRSQCCDSAAAQDDDAVRARAITLRYVETLVQWADSLTCRNSPEAFQKARLILDTASRILGAPPRTIAEHQDAQETPMSVAGFMPHFAPLNPRLLSLYETTENRLSMVHACLSGHRLRNGVPNRDMPYWGNSALRDGWKGGIDACEDDGCCAPCKPYRFSVLIKQAQDLANEVKAFGSALLSAYEKGDAEYLSSLREVHSKQIQSLTLSIRENQWRDADWQVMALKKTKESTSLRLVQTQTLFVNGLIALEQSYENRTQLSIYERLASNTIEVISSALRYSPDVYSGQNNFLHLPVGSKLADIGAAAARAVGAMADYWGSRASLDLTEAGFDRRETEWANSIAVLTIEIQQIEDQILGADRRRDAALQELNNLQRQIEQSAEVLDFLRDKFTSDALYVWMQKETASLHRRAYELALNAARQAQRAFNSERGHTTRSFLPRDAWDDLHEGLLAGDRLQLALKEMEKAYYDENCREYELAKHISLRQHAPFAFLKLKMTGACDIELPEWLYDQDYPGQYMRRIRSVALTVPCVTGPFVGVHCKLTLLSSATRIDPRLSDEAHACCDDRPDCDNGYAAKPDDARIARQYSAVEAIATSSGQNDGGVFELNFRDERYLPFEGAGATSRWRIEIPQSTNFFDPDTISDVILHMSYTAREGGSVLSAAAQCESLKRLPGDGWRLFDMRHDFPMAWHEFANPRDCDCRYLPLRLARKHFPFIPNNPGLKIGDIHVFFETECAVPSRHYRIELLDSDTAKHCPPRPGCNTDRIECIASAEWPNLFHGIIDGRDRPLEANCDFDLGTIWFPPDVPGVERIYLIVRYEKLEPCPAIAHPETACLQTRRP